VGVLELVVLLLLELEHADAAMATVAAIATPPSSLE